MDLTDPTPELTVCVPPNAEVAKLVTLLSGNGSVPVTDADVSEIIANHISLGKADAATLLALPDGSQIPVLSGLNLTLYNSDGNITLGTGVVNVTVIVPDQDACAQGSIIHQLDGILLPPGTPVTPDILAHLDSTPLAPDGSIAANAGGPNLAPTPPPFAPPSKTGANTAGIVGGTISAVAFAIGATLMVLIFVRKHHFHARLAGEKGAAGARGMVCTLCSYLVDCVWCAWQLSDRCGHCCPWCSDHRVWLEPVVAAQ
jgi:Fasciclin domain